MKTYSELRQSGWDSLQNKWGQAIVALVPIILLLVVILLPSALLETIDAEQEPIRYLIHSMVGSLGVLLLTYLMIIPLEFGYFVALYHKYHGSEESTMRLMWRSFKKDYGFSIGLTILVGIFAGLYMILYYVVLIILFVVCTANIDLAFADFMNDPTLIADYMNTSVWVCLVLMLVSTVLAFWALIDLSLKYSMVYFIRAENPRVPIWECMKHSKKTMKGHKCRLFVLELSFIGWALLGCITLGIAFLFVYPYIISTLAAFYDEVRLDEEIERPFVVLEENIGEKVAPEDRQID